MIYYLYNKDGIIVQRGNHIGDIAEFSIPKDLNLGIGISDNCKVNVTNKKLVPIKSSPGINYKFDLITNEWITTDTYIDNRRKEYPLISDQLDMLYHAMENGEISVATEWFNTIQEVKDKYPKEINNG